MHYITHNCAFGAPPKQGWQRSAYIFLSASLVLSGCTTPAFTQATGAKAGLCGQEVAEAALSAYDDLGAVADDYAYYQGYLRIVVSPEPDKVDFTKVSDADMSALLAERARVCRQLKNAYALFYQLCSNRTDPQTNPSYAALSETLKALSKDESSSPETKKLAGELSNDVVSQWQAMRIVRTQAVIERLTHDFRALWEKDVPAWNAYIDDVYIHHYAAGLLSLRLSNFDEKELVKKVDDPYGAPVKAGLFKLQKYREASQKAAHLKEKLQRVSKAFEQLTLLHRQLSDPAVAQSDLLTTQNKIARYAEKAEQGRKE